MLNNKWHSIWNNRTTDHNEINLQTLINLDGFDSGAGKINAIDWTEYTRRLVDLLHIENGESVYEVGCGSGALLYSISEHVDIKAGGNDYSDRLINVAKEAFQIPDNFTCTEASQISTFPNLTTQYLTEYFIIFQKTTQPLF